MNNYSIEELNIGHKESFSVIIEREMLEHFLCITKDINPLHNDAEFAKKCGFEDRVVYGLLTSSFLSTLAGVYLPGRRSLIQGVETKYLKPVFIGDELNITGEVTEIHESVGQIVLKVLIVNQNGVKVLKGQMKIGFLNER